MRQRYQSGTSLDRTKKEELIDALEKELRGEMSEGLAIALKTLSAANLKELRVLAQGAKDEED